MNSAPKSYQALMKTSRSRNSPTDCFDLNLSFLHPDYFIKTSSYLKQQGDTIELNLMNRIISLDQDQIIRCGAEHSIS